MADGPIDPDAGDGGGPEEGPILSPEELDIADDEHVTQLDEGRFVVSPDARQQESGDQSRPSEPTPSADSAAEGEPETTSEDTAEATPQSGAQSPQPGVPETESLTQAEVHEWLRESFADNPSRYGFDITGSFDGRVSQRRMASNDVVTIFESLVLWYAQQVDSDTPVEQILGILLTEANVPIRYPPENLKHIVKSAGLGPDDTIADLLAAVDEDDGIKL